MIVVFLLTWLGLPIPFEPAQLKQTAPVVHNLNTVGSTWVIAELNIGANGRVRLARALKGDEPLRSIVLASLRRWSFTPARTAGPVESQVTVIFLFRPRSMFSAPPPDLTGVSAADTNKPPLPISISDPGYLATSIAEGEVILELRVSEFGAAGNARTVKGIGGLTEFTERATRTWKFSPAYSKGQPVPGTVIVAVSYLRPAVLQGVFKESPSR